MKKLIICLLIIGLFVGIASAIEIVRQKNVATYIFFPMVDADGDIVTSAAGLDSEIDAYADGAAPDGFTDCTNEATEIGSDGVYYLSLSQAEMNVDYLYVQIKTSTEGAKTQHLLIRTIEGDPLALATVSANYEIAVNASGDLGMDLDNVSGTLSDGEVETITVEVNTKTGFSLSDAGNEAVADSVWGEERAEHTTGNTFGGDAMDNDVWTDAKAAFVDHSIATVDGNVDNIVLYTDGDGSDGIDADIGGDALDDNAWDDGTRTLTAIDEDATTLDFDGTTVGDVTNEVTADVTKISGDATAADNAELFFDGTGYAGTNNVIPTVTTTTNLTTNNDKTGYALSSAGVDALWDEDTTGHNTAKSFGLMLKDTSAYQGEASALSAGAIARAVKDTATIYPAIWTDQSSGAGTEQETLIVLDGDDNAVEGAKISIWNSSGTPYANNITDGNGKHVFYLDVGTYITGTRRVGIHSSTDTLEITADGTDTIDVVAYSAGSAPGSDSVCIEGYVFDLGYTYPTAGLEAMFYLGYETAIQDTSTGVFLEKVVVTADVNSVGYFKAYLPASNNLVNWRDHIAGDWSSADTIFYIVEIKKDTRVVLPPIEGVFIPDTTGCLNIEDIPFR